MKTLYTSPVITVEELTKIDVLCVSSEGTFDALTDSDPMKDNLNQNARTIGDLSSIL